MEAGRAARRQKLPRMPVDGVSQRLPRDVPSIPGALPRSEQSEARHAVEAGAARASHASRAHCAARRQAEHVHTHVSEPPMIFLCEQSSVGSVPCARASGSPFLSPHTDTSGILLSPLTDEETDIQRQPREAAGVTFLAWHLAHRCLVLPALLRGYLHLQMRKPRLSRARSHSRWSFWLHSRCW